MASSVSSSTSSSQSASLAQQAADIQKQIAAATNQARTGATADMIQNFQKTNTKSALNSAAGATDIGFLKNNTTRINAFSTLQKTDKVDYVKFRAQTAGPLKMGAIGSNTLRFQLMTQNGVVLADNDPKASKDLHDAFDKLGGGTLNVKAGVYLVKISVRSDAPPPPKNGTNYSVQFSMGGYTQDYDTIMKPPAAGTDPYAPPDGINQLTSMLSDMMTTTSSLPAIGTSGTDKLLGQWTNLLA
jgi:hypothetical protein